MKPDTTIFWFRQDLRLRDNPALAAAIARGGPVVPVFLWSPEEQGCHAPGAASRWWLHYSLASLDRSLREAGVRLTLRQGQSASLLANLARETGASAVFWNRCYEPELLRRDGEVKRQLAGAGIEVQEHESALLFAPEQLRNASGRPFKVFSPFWKACLALLPALEEELPMAKFPPGAPGCASMELADLDLLPTPDWAAGLRAAWTPGEPGALARLREFLDGALSDYAGHRDRPAAHGVSRLSPHLHFGEIGPRQAARAVLESIEQAPSPDAATSAAGYLRQLGWREFACHLLSHFPWTPDAALRPEFAAFPWRSDAPALKAWQRGRTGYPMVDAGMRELWATGWMHNRARMVTASFLTKDLLLPWQSGALWFQDTLVDADLACNTLGWQWIAGCGADAAPYFRVFNPVRQGEKFDPEGTYVREWIPELRRLSTEWIHRPWLAPASALRDADIVLGKTYPSPLVDHGRARERALAAFAAMRQKESLR